MKGNFGTSNSAEKIPIYRGEGVYNIERLPIKGSKFGHQTRQRTYLYTLGRGYNI
jgi:hypothetical protein